MSSFPVFHWFIFSGVDLLDAFGIRNGSASGTREDTGIQEDEDEAFRIIGWRADLSVPKM